MILTPSSEVGEIGTVGASESVNWICSAELLGVSGSRNAETTSPVTVRNLKTSTCSSIFADHPFNIAAKSGLESIALAAAKVP